ncbi:MAG: DUF560 domain-containing protein [Desulfobacteraceae bacterium]|nr:DUF560 domain-containing protein [Desulfobacteraceae bacterium]
MNKIASMILFVGLVFGPGPAWAMETGRDSHFARGTRLFNAKDFNNAYNELFKAFVENPGDSDINFHLGRAAFETGNHEMALMAFERVLMADPEAIRVKLEMGRTFAMLGSRNHAKRYFNEVLATNPPEMVRQNINAFLRTIAAREKKHFFNGFLAIGCDWDDNVRVAPASEIIKTALGDIRLTGDSASPREDLILNATAILRHTYRFPDTGLSWRTTGTGYHGNYKDETDLNTLYLGISTGPHLALGRFTAGIQGLYSHLELDNTRYQRIAGGESVAGFVVTPSLLLNARCRYEKKTFFKDPDRDAQTGSIELMAALVSGATWYNASMAMEIENADSDVYSYDRYKGKFSVEHRFSHGISLFANYEFQQTWYEKPYELFNRKRDDTIHYLGGGIRKELWVSPAKNTRLFLQLSYRYTNANSSLDLYEYEKNVAYSLLGYEF